MGIYLFKTKNIFDIVSLVQFDNKGGLCGLSLNRVITF